MSVLIVHTRLPGWRNERPSRTSSWTQRQGTFDQPQPLTFSSNHLVNHVSVLASRSSTQLPAQAKRIEEIKSKEADRMKNFLQSMGLEGRFGPAAGASGGES